VKVNAGYHQGVDASMQADFIAERKQGRWVVVKMLEPTVVSRATKRSGTDAITFQAP
jgi:hypothetical protein